MKSKEQIPNPYAEAIDPDTVEIRIKGQSFRISAAEASMYAAHIRNAAHNCDMMIDEGFVPQRLDTNKPPQNPLTIAREWEIFVKKDRDGEGKRFWIAALYLLGGERQKAYDYCTNFIKHCKKMDYRYDDPAFLFTYLLAVLDSRSEINPGSLTSTLCYHLYISNPYFLDIALGKEVEPLDGRVHFTNVTSLGWAKSLPSWLAGMLTPEQKSALIAFQKTITYKSFIETHTALNKACIVRGEYILKELHAFEAMYELDSK